MGGRGKQESCRWGCTHPSSQSGPQGREHLFCAELWLNSLAVCARLHLKQRLEKGWSVSSTAAVCRPKLQMLHKRTWKNLRVHTPMLVGG